MSPRIASLAALALLAGCNHASQPVPGMSTCADPVAGCGVTVHGQQLVVRFSELPRTMRPFQLTVQAPSAREVSADFAMQGMQMGPNRYRLQRGADGVWHAQVILPACVAGRSDWLLTLTADSASVAVAFSASR